MKLFTTAIVALFFVATANSALIKPRNEGNDTKSNQGFNPHYSSWITWRVAIHQDTGVVLDNHAVPANAWASLPGMEDTANDNGSIRPGRGTMKRVDQLIMSDMGGDVPAFEPESPKRNFATLGYQAHRF
ncbi:hypothetical protein SUNI508_04668 [Seiridium unicorne]|uniref:Uncharacterized protein n=1 Tax=Seiridium unicorne TaxID=138068 RepID=A0ABR2V849_9PEZI